MKNDTVRQAWWEYHCAVADLGPDHPTTLRLLRALHAVDPSSRPPKIRRRLVAPVLRLLAA